MGILGTPINPDTAEHQKNKEAYRELLESYQPTFDQAFAPDRAEPSIKRHLERGKLFVRDRIEQLLDDGAPFLEIAPLAGLNLYEGVRPGAGIVTGIGVVSGKQCVIIANDATVKGGTYYPLTVKKHLRAQEIALTNHLPCIYLVDSGGAYLPLQDEVFPDKEHFGRIFFNQARMSALGIPQIAVVLGSCTAGGAYVPAMSDQTIMVREQATIFLGGPPLVKAATGQEITAEELGGADVHCKISGVADHLADNEHEALRQAREIVAHLGARELTHYDIAEPRDPLYPAEDIYSLIPPDSKKYFPIREIMARLFDGSRFDEFKKEYGKTLICGFARIDGRLVGILANDGILFSESALKGAHFIQLCDKRGIPLLFLQNVVGFMVGKEYEHGGIAKDGAKLVNAVSCARVPKITFILGGSFGAGNYGMCGRAYDPRVLFSWPGSKIAVMGAEQASTVLTQVREDSYKAKKKKWSAKEKTAYGDEIRESFESQSHAFYATARLWDDGIIDPVHTRTVISLSLAMSACAPLAEEVSYGVFRM